VQQQHGAAVDLVVQRAVPGDDALRIGAWLAAELHAEDHVLAV